MTLPRTPSTTAMIDQAREEQRVQQIQAAFFVSMMNALIHGTGEFRKILSRARKFHEAGARGRIEIRRAASEQVQRTED